MLEREGAFRERVDEWISAHELQSTVHEQGRGIRLGVGVYHIQNRVPRLTRKRESRRAHSSTRRDVLPGEH